MPPANLYIEEVKPGVPEGIPAHERMEYFLDAYAARGDAIDRANARFRQIDTWVQKMAELYGVDTEQDDDSE